ncbi:MAG: hypothetical protein QXN34_00005 [Archaeoglobaceae archaeon]
MVSEAFYELIDEKRDIGDVFLEPIVDFIAEPNRHSFFRSVYIFPIPCLSLFLAPFFLFLVDVHRRF